MEFNEKLQALRKSSGLTQEQVAEKLYVSRTAVSKWETGGGYPNLDSLTSIARLFGVTVDDLLSGEELISLAGSEDRSTLNRVLLALCGVLDLIAVSFIFLPLYGVLQEDGFVRAVPLIEYYANTQFGIGFFVLLSLISLLGIIEAIGMLMGSSKPKRTLVERYWLCRMLSACG